MIKPGTLCLVVGGGLYEGRIVTAIKYDPHFINGEMLDVWLVETDKPLPAFRNGNVERGEMRFVTEGHMLTSWLKPIEPPQGVEDERRERVCSD